MSGARLTDLMSAPLNVHDGRVVRTATVLVSSRQDKCFKLQVKGFELYLCDTWSSKRKDCGFNFIDKINYGRFTI